MIRAQKLMPLCIALTFLTSCANWVWLDGSNVDSQSLENAERQCQIEERLAMMEEAQEQLDRDLQLAETSQERQEVQKAFNLKDRQINTAIRTCMRTLGLKAI